MTDSTDTSPFPPPRTVKRWLGRPRFVVVLVAVLLAVAVRDLAGLAALASGSGEVEISWMGLHSSGAVAVAALVLRLALHAAGAWGLWGLKAWARRGGMGYLGALLASSMLVWSPGGYGAGYAGFAILWQVSAVPLAVFCFMYLFTGEKLFS